MRIRTIKPEFWTSLTVTSLPLRTRLTFIGIWNYSDDEGRSLDEPRLLKAAVWPLDDDITHLEVDEDLDRLAAAGLIDRYQAGGRLVLQVRAWAEHQRVDHAKPSKLPPLEESATSPESIPTTARSIRDASRRPREASRLEQGTGNREGNREQGTREDARPAEPALVALVEDPGPEVDRQELVEAHPVGEGGEALVRRLHEAMARGRKSWDLPAAAAEVWDELGEPADLQPKIRFLADYVRLHAGEPAIDFSRIGRLARRWGKVALGGIDIALANGREAPALYNYAEKVCQRIAADLEARSAAEARA